jgi:general secretion pathway protein B
MSLLLDALHRSDQERNNDTAVPGLQTRHLESAISENPARMLMAGSALLVVVALLSWLYFGGSENEGGDVSALSKQAAVTVTDPAPAGAPSTARPATAKPAIATPVVAPAVTPPVITTQRPAIASSETPGLTVEEPRTINTDKPVSAGQGIPVPAEVAELYQRAATPVAAATGPASPAAGAPAAGTPAAGSPAAPSSTLPVDAIVAATQQELAAPPLDDDPTPLVQDLPQRTKDEIPSIFFSSHSWSNNTGEKQVILNGEVRREGETVLPGVQLIEILPESIVLDFQGTRFRLRALNSWVNL